MENSKHMYNLERIYFLAGIRLGVLDKIARGKDLKYWVGYLGMIDQKIRLTITGR